MQAFGILREIVWAAAHGGRKRISLCARSKMVHRVFNYWPATKYLNSHREYAYFPGIGKRQYAINAIRHWRKLMSGVENSALVKGSLHGIMGWYADSVSTYSKALLEKYSEYLADPNKDYDSSMWVGPASTPDRELALWLQAGVTLLIEKPGGWTKDEYEKKAIGLLRLIDTEITILLPTRSFWIHTLKNERYQVAFALKRCLFFAIRLPIGLQMEMKFLLLGV